MTYLYVCDACKKEDHDNCEGARDTPPPDACGGGVCICGGQGHDANNDLVIAIRNDDENN